RARGGGERLLPAARGRRRACRACRRVRAWRQARHDRPTAEPDADRRLGRHHDRLARRPVAECLDGGDAFRGREGARATGPSVCPFPRRPAYSPVMNRRGCAVLTMLAILGCGRSQARQEAARDSAMQRVMDSIAPPPPPAPESSRTETRPAVTKAPKTIDAVLAAHNDSLMAVPGVLGTAVGRCDGAPCIR